MPARARPLGAPAAIIAPLQQSVGRSIAIIPRDDNRRITIPAEEDGGEHVTALDGFFNTTRSFHICLGKGCVAPGSLSLSDEERVLL